MTDHPPKLTVDESAMHPDIFLALGTLVFTASTVETELGLFINWLIGHPNHDRVLPLVGGMDIKVKLTLIRILCAQQFPLHNKVLSKLCDDIGDAFDKRNKFVHSLIAPTDNPRVLQLQPTKFTRNGNLPPAEPYTPEQILAVGKELFHSHKSLKDAFNRLPAKQG